MTDCDYLDTEISPSAATMQTETDERFKINNPYIYYAWKNARRMAVAYNNDDRYLSREKNTLKSENYR